MSVPTVERGVEIAKSLFVEDFAQKIPLQPKVLSAVETVTLGNLGQVTTIRCKLDTGAYRSSLDRNIAKQLDIPINEKETLLVKAASGKQLRPTADAVFVLAGKKIKTTVTITDRSEMRFPMIIGRCDLKGFLINPTISDEPGDQLTEREE